MDMAVGVIVGGAFTAIVTSLNQDILTPILAIFGGTDFSNLYVKLGSGDTPCITKRKHRQRPRRKNARSVRARSLSMPQDALIVLLS